MVVAGEEVRKECSARGWERRVLSVGAGNRGSYRERKTWEKEKAKGRQRRTKKSDRWISKGRG